MNKKQLVPDTQGWWWRYEIAWMTVEIREIHGTLVYGDGQYHIRDDGYWGGPVTPPKWTPKSST
jgi:hypothetical protein